MSLMAPHHLVAFSESFFLPFSSILKEKCARLQRMDQVHSYPLILTNFHSSISTNWLSQIWWGTPPRCSLTACSLSLESLGCTLCVLICHPHGLMRSLYSLTAASQQVLSSYLWCEWINEIGAVRAIGLQLATRRVSPMNWGIWTSIKDLNSFIIEAQFQWRWTLMSFPSSD